MVTPGGALRVTVVAPDDLPHLPAAVEVAAYRIVVEALTNVARNASSPSASVSLAIRPAGLTISVEDAGGLSTQDWSPGVGLGSMRERATELGGSLSAGPGTTGGRVEAVLPLAHPAGGP
jgi:two-component system NarL family sensor kinase